MLRSLLTLGMLGVLGTPAIAAPPPADVRATLDSKPSGVAIFTVLADGQDDFLCQTPCVATLPRGQVTLKARHFGMREVVKNLDLKRTSVAKVTFPMEVLPEHTLVDVTSTIAVDEVQIDGFTLMTLPGWLVLPYGEHNALGKREGRTVWEYDFVTRGPRAELVIGPTPQS